MDWRGDDRRFTRGERRDVRKRNRRKMVVVGRSVLTILKAIANRAMSKKEKHT